MVDPHADPFNVSIAELEELASEPVLRRGVAYHRDGHVLELDWEFGYVWARVKGSRPHRPYEVELSADAEGELAVSCTCPFDAEPACKHAVAALLAYTERRQGGPLTAAKLARREVADRQKRGRDTVAVELVQGQPWLGVWKARSAAASPYSPAHWRVQIRGTSDRGHYCGCPDFATNRLGTCKHVEAVLHTLRRDHADERDSAAATSARRVLIRADWESSRGPRVRASYGRDVSAALRERLEPLFNADGYLRPPWEPNLKTAERALVEVDGGLIGDDAWSVVRQSMDQRRRAARGAEIRQAIQRAGGRLDDFHGTLYPYQVEGTAFLAGTGRALLADDMGLGKTVQALAAAQWLIAEGAVARVVVVCPASLKAQWAREIERFSDHPVADVSGGAEARAALYRRRTVYTVVNYEVVLRDVDRINQYIAPDLLIVDEAQRIRNWRTKTAAAVKALHSDYVFVLTGTPLESRLEDLYSLMQAVDPRVLGPLWRYMVDFHVLDADGRVQGYRNLGELRQRLRPVMLRRERMRVASQLPDRLETRLDVPMTARQRAVHDDALGQATHLAAVSRSRSLSAGEERTLLTALQRARMTGNALGLVEPGAEASPKLDELRRILEDVAVDSGEKVVIFSEWERMTALAAELVESLGLGFVRLHGGVPVGQRAERVQAFVEDPSTQVFVSTDAGAVGLNLQVATFVVHLELPWSPSTLDQRVARVHRLGQSYPVRVLTLLADASYEQRMARLFASKRALFDAVIHPDSVVDDLALPTTAVAAVVGDLQAIAPEATPRVTDPPVTRQRWAEDYALAEAALTRGHWAAAFDALIAALLAELRPKSKVAASARLASWLWSEAVPTRQVSAEDAALLTRLIALRNDPGLDEDLCRAHVRELRLRLSPAPLLPDDAEGVSPDG